MKRGVDCFSKILFLKIDIIWPKFSNIFFRMVLEILLAMMIINYCALSF